jgi:hypothetical protein
MADYRGAINIRYTFKQSNEDALRGINTHSLPVSRWRISPILVPTCIVAVFLTTFFFSLFFILLLIVGFILPLCIWCLRWNLHKSSLTEYFVSERVVIEVPPVVKTQYDKVKYRDQLLGGISG